MAKSQPCPNEDALQALLDGALPEAKSNALAAHLDGCTQCRQRLEALVGSSDAIPPEAAAILDSPGESDALAQAMQRLKGDTADETRTETESSIGPPSLGFLSSSENPRHLGRLGEYEILEVIGRGGMGTVLKARDPKLERLVAVKVLNPELAASGAARARFLREARSAAAVTHEHAVTIHAVDEQNQVPYLVMEYVLGVSLEDRIQKSGHLRIEEILRIGMQTASGLAAAHAQGLVHRDIKPSNILLENAVERVKITDFGLARVMHEAQVTQSNLVAGTPQYMSPEQARGEPVDHRSDLFSLGCVLYAMCTGRSPFRAETPTGAIHRVCDDTPRPIRQVNPEIPEWLVAIIDRLLEKKPEDRFQTAEEAAEILGQYLAHVQQPSRVQLPRAHELAAARRGKLRLAWKTVTLMSLALAVIIVLSLTDWQHMQSPPPESTVPPGPGVARFAVIDIQPIATRARTEPTDGNDARNNLAEVPATLEVDGVPFQIGPRYIQLAGEETPGWPTGVSGIAVHRKAAKLHFLHGCARGYPQFGARVATYTLRYDDGSSAELPVVTGRHLINWWVRSDHRVRATRAATAWTGSNPTAAEKGYAIQVFACCRENPHPEKTIATIDFQSGPLKHAYPFCLGVTSDQDPTPLAPEPGLLAVSIGRWYSAPRYSVAITGSPEPPIRGQGTRHHLLLPPGRHQVEIRDGDTLVRRGAVNLDRGSRADLAIDGPHALFPLPTPQPESVDELVGQSSGIWDIALSRDAKTLATGAGDGTIVLWRREGSTWRKHIVLPRHNNIVRSVAFSPNGDFLATGSQDGSLKLWEVASGQLVATLKEDAIGVYAVGFSPDGRTLVSGNGDGTVDVWDANTHAKLASFTAYAHMVYDLAFSPDGSLLATGTWGDNTVKVWDVASWQPRHVMFGHTGSVAAVRFSPDGHTLASASEDGTVKLWDVETGGLVRTFTHPQGLLAVAFNPAGDAVAAGGVFHTVRVWDLPSGNVVHDFHAHWGNVRSLTFSPEGKTLLTGAADNSTRLWSLVDLPGPFQTELPAPEPRATFNVHEDWSMCAAFSAKTMDLLAAVGLSPFDLQVWRLRDFSRVAKFSVRENDEGYMLGESLVFTPKEGALITCLSREGKPHIALWDPEKRLRRAAFEPGSIPRGQGFSVAKMALSADGTALAVASRGEALISMLDPATRETRWSLPSPHGKPVTLAISSDGQVVAVGTDIGLVMLLDAETGNEMHKPLRHADRPVNAVAISSQEILASAGVDGVVKLWDLASFEGIALPKVHQEKLDSAAFSPDGRLLVTAGGASFSDKAQSNHKGEVCLWDVATKKLLAKFHAHYGSVTCAVFSPDGRSLATTGRDGKMHLWDVPELLEHSLAPDSAPASVSSSTKGGS